MMKRSMFLLVVATWLTCYQFAAQAASVPESQEQSSRQARQIISLPLPPMPPLVENNIAAATLPLVFTGTFLAASLWNILANRTPSPPPPPPQGFIITGGGNSAAEKKVELFNPISRRSCPLPDLPRKMSWHSHCGNLLCRDKSCLKMNSTGSFSRASVSLLQERWNHLCWSLPGGGGEVMLLGGRQSPNSTEIVSADGSSTKPSGDLKYETREACGVEVDDTFIVTGGLDPSAPDGALNSVVRYNSQGVPEEPDLPSLTVRRYHHACASYLNDNGQRVVLVNGGENVGAGDLDSTEMMVDFNAWTTVAANLPSARSGHRAASLDNKVFLFGGYEGSSLYSILLYDTERDAWQPAGNMTVPRFDHAVAVFPDVSQLCP